jgi:hypothetical protein
MRTKNKTKRHKSLNGLVGSVSLTGKVICRRARDLGSNSTYTKNQLVFWPDGRSNHHGAKKN